MPYPSYIGASGTYDMNGNPTHTGSNHECASIMESAHTNDLACTQCGCVLRCANCQDRVDPSQNGATVGYCASYIPPHAPPTSTCPPSPDPCVLTAGEETVGSSMKADNGRGFDTTTTGKSTASHTIQSLGALTDMRRLERGENIALAADGQSELGRSLSTLPPPYFPASRPSTGNVG